MTDEFTLEWETDEICQVYRNGECMGTDEVVDLLNEQQAEIMRLIIQLKCINQIKPLKKEIPDSIDIVISNDVELLQNLTDENKKLKTLNYVFKEAIRLNGIKEVQIGNENVDLTKEIDWGLLDELYGSWWNNEV